MPVLEKPIDLSAQSAKLNTKSELQGREQLLDNLLKGTNEECFKSGNIEMQLSRINRRHLSRDYTHNGFPFHKDAYYQIDVGGKYQPHCTVFLDASGKILEATGKNLKSFLNQNHISYNPKGLEVGAATYRNVFNTSNKTQHQQLTSEDKKLTDPEALKKMFGVLKQELKESNRIQPSADEIAILRTKLGNHKSVSFNWTQADGVASSNIDDKINYNVTLEKVPNSNSIILKVKQHYTDGDQTVWNEIKINGSNKIISASVKYDQNAAEKMSSQFACYKIADIASHFKQNK